MIKTRTAVLGIIIIVAGCLALTMSLKAADADTPDAALVMDAPGPAAGSAAPLPSDSLDNPIDAPKAAYDDARAAFKTNWALGILAALVMLCRGLQVAAQRHPTLPLLSKLAANARALFIVGAIATVAVDAYNALYLGGSGWAVFFAALMAAIGLINAPAKKAAV